MVMGKVTDRCWRNIQSCSSELSWLDTHEELVTEDVLNSVVEAPVSLWKQRVNNADNCHVATWTITHCQHLTTKGTLQFCLSVTPEGKQCTRDLGSPVRIKECFPPVWTWKAWSFYLCNEQIKLWFWINLQSGYFQTSIHFCPWFCSVQYLYP